MEKSDWKDAPILSRLEVLEVLDAQSRVLKGTVLPNGAAHTVSTPTILHMLPGCMRISWTTVTFELLPGCMPKEKC